MQQRYLGDIHDFQKFIFVKFLSIFFKKKIGLNWYLVDPKKIGEKEVSKKDGEKRYFLQKNEFKTIDRKIYEECVRLKSEKFRNITIFTKKTHLNQYVSFYNKKIPIFNREKWLDDSLNFFKKKDIIFLDPDNGLLKNKKSKKISLKYVLVSEIETYLSKKKTVIFTQFQSFNKTNIVYLKEIKNYLKTKNIKINCPVVINRTAPNTIFISISNDKKMELKLKRSIEKFCLINSKRVKLITI
ncbi:MAG: hypothetical protein CMP38_04005 [Rickettsiales bacterium]|nr:hypothetical protein [Rickettsiales bacterium]|tara:strand:+ start:1014 stop:1739 length:726 start_codon:yes stop_codon:yes gene_type:complete